MVFQILSLSGGGFLGLYTASVLAEIERRTGRPLADSFDLIAGTSVGGIIGLGLSAGCSAAEIKQAFLDEGDKIFSPKRPASNFLSTGARILSGLPKSRYDSAPLRSIIERIVGFDTRMSDLRRPTIIPAVNLTKGGPKVFKTGHHPRFIIDWQLKGVDVALATSAAPTYFPIHQIGTELYADGGMFANSPDLIALHEAETFLEVERENVRVLSVGTTTTAFAFSASAGRKLGSYGWFKNERLPSVMIGSQQALTDDMMRHVIADRYVRIDRAQPPDQQAELALDCASPIAKRDLQSAAASSIAEISSNRMLHDMLDHVAPEFTFTNATL
ncbi:CBASS cGAMP-activated phospholipase [Agrobacterium vitis]|uniref:CBASS cGAMP-activated phospholipase n=1 Tax=Agrobacterium vitis TaxID=373 RepID=UPI002034FD75|nr:CBASS cGAMP-activated phospholipase [Agrobacterium vitis]MCM2453723.1 patatin-like phospholipase family protein [Agrobacterium vitis]